MKAEEKQDLVCRCDARLPAARYVLVLDESGRTIFTFGRPSRADKTLIKSLVECVSPDFEQSIFYYTDKIFIAMRLSKGFIVCSLDKKANIARNLLRLREIGESVWG